MVRVVSNGDNEMSSASGYASRRNANATLARQVGLITVLSNIRIPPETQTSQGVNSNIPSSPVTPTLQGSGATVNANVAGTIQLAYRGHNGGATDSSVTGDAELPVLHLSGSSLGSTNSEFRAMLDVIESDAARSAELGAGASVSDGVRANNTAEIEAIATNLRTAVESEPLPDCSEFRVPELLTPMSDSDSEVVPPPKMKKLSRTTGNRAAKSWSSSVKKSQGKAASTTEDKTSILRRFLTAKPTLVVATPSTSRIATETSTASTSTSKVAKGKAVLGRRPVKKCGRKDAVVPVVETPIVSLVSESGSGSESELEVFSQQNQRNVFKISFKEFDNVEREHRSNRAAFQDAEMAVGRSEELVRRLEADRQRIDDEIRRLVEEQHQISEQLRDAEQDLTTNQQTRDEHRRVLGKSTMKIETIRKRLKRFLE